MSHATPPEGASSQAAATTEAVVPLAAPRFTRADREALVAWVREHGTAARLEPQLMHGGTTASVVSPASPPHFTGSNFEALYHFAREQACPEWIRLPAALVLRRTYRPVPALPPALRPKAVHWWADSWQDAQAQYAELGRHPTWEEVWLRPGTSHTTPTQ